MHFGVDTTKDMAIPLNLDQVLCASARSQGIEKYMLVHGAGFEVAF